MHKIDAVITLSRAQLFKERELAPDKDPEYLGAECLSMRPHGPLTTHASISYNTDMLTLPSSTVIIVTNWRGGGSKLNSQKHTIIIIR